MSNLPSVQDLLTLGFTRTDLVNYQHSTYRILYRNAYLAFDIIDIGFLNMTVAIDFKTYGDALAYLTEDVQVI
jgi:hypothetical protein